MTSGDQKWHGESTRIYRPYRVGFAAPASAILISVINVYNSIFTTAKEVMFS